MKSNVPVPLQVLVASFLIILFTVQSADFFSFVQQWPWSYCDKIETYVCPMEEYSAVDFAGHWPTIERGPPYSLVQEQPFNVSKIRGISGRSTEKLRGFEVIIPLKKKDNDVPHCVHPCVRNSVVAGQEGLHRIFYIHGLWPNPESNNSTPFNKLKFSDPLIKKLKENWPDLRHPEDSMCFWKYEWEKHGNCSWKILDQSAYFKKALELKDKFDLLGILKSAGIEPNDSRDYPAETISNAIKNATGFTPRIRCKKRKGKLLLLEIRQCVDRSMMNFINCAAKMNASISEQCVGNITLPRYRD